MPGQLKDFRSVVVVTKIHILATRANGRVGRVNGAINHTSEIVYGDRHNFLHNKRATVRFDRGADSPRGWMGGSEVSRCGAALIGHF